MLLGAGDAQDADRLVHGERHAPDRDVVHGAVVLVRPGGVAEKAGQGGVYLTPGVVAPPARHRLELTRELLGPHREILGDVIEDLAPVVTAHARPRRGSVRRFDGVADVFAVAFADFTE